jgi:hypothetical protein
MHVIYLMSHAAHLPYLVASLHTLRRYYNGGITVYAWRESWDIVHKYICPVRAVGGLFADCVLREPAYRGRNDQFLDKIALVRSMNPRENVLYLDADTTVHGQLTRLFDAAGSFGFCATQFNNWYSNSHMMSGRIRSLLAYPQIDRMLINRVASEPWPSVNGGVFAARGDSPVLPLWYEWTMAATVPQHTFIADEKVLHILQLRFVPTGEMHVMQRYGQFNCSPHHQSPALKDEDVVIRHYHGDSNLRPDKSPKGHALWWPIYQHCLAQNVGVYGTGSVV